MTELKPLPVEINISKIVNVAHVGVRRAVLFMGLGLNAAHRDDFEDYQLSKLPRVPGQLSLAIEFFPDDLPSDRIREFKSTFAEWITGAGMRELMEHYATFLDQLYFFALVVEKVKGDKNFDGQKLHRDFIGKGIPGKLAILREKSIEPKNADWIGQLYHARNALTHDHGLVTRKRCDGNDALNLNWLTVDTYGVGEVSGKEFDMGSLIGIPTSEAMSIYARFTERSKTIPVGSKLIFSQQELWEICFFFSAVAIPSAARSFVDFLERLNVPFRDTESAVPVN